MKRAVCIHGHFYQPPRENPWIEEVEVQDSAAPFHDWNERITAECYAPNAQSRILDGDGRIVRIVNNYSRISFNFGPTLLSWLEAKAPDTYAAVLEADRQSRERFRLLVESATDYALLILDPQGRVASWNLGAERIKGYREEEIVGRHFSCFYPPEAVERGWPEHELKVAAEIQRGLLPVPNVTGAFFTAAASSAPCLAVGGDFFDYVDLPGGRFGFIVGDVAGKGSPAALLASAVTGMCGAESTYQTSPAAVISRINHGLFRRSIENRFLTAFYGVLASDGALAFTNGGHNAPVLVTSSGIRRLETGGMVLGLFEQSTFEEETVALQPGDFVIVFSDGVTEALNTAGEEYMDDRLLASIDRHRKGGLESAQQFLENLLADVRAFCDGEMPHDDITLLLVRYDGSH